MSAVILHGVHLPAGWSYEARADYTVIVAPWGFVSIDYDRRGYRPGISRCGRFETDTKYGGRGWRQALTAHAVRWLDDCAPPPRKERTP